MLKQIDLTKMVKSPNLPTLNKLKPLSRKSSVKKKTNKLLTGYSQDILPIKEIAYGIIKTKDNRYIKILEILPFNFYVKPDEVKDSISEGFSSIFKYAVKKACIKVITDRMNPQGMVEHLLRCSVKETNPKVKARIMDNINLIKDLSKEESISKRFFFIFEYEGNSDGKRSNKFEVVAKDMMQTEMLIRSEFAAIGNTVIDPPDLNYFTGDVLYTLLNRKSSKNESFNTRLIKLNSDQVIYNECHENKKSITTLDCIAPRGIRFYDDYQIIDGTYYTYLMLTGDTYPPLVEAGWCDLFTMYNDSTDIDITTEKLNKEVVKQSIKQLNKFQNVAFQVKSEQNSSGAAALGEKLSEMMYILDRLNQEQDLFNVTITITIRASSREKLFDVRNQIIKKMSDADIKFETPMCNVKEFFYATLPLLYNKTSVHKRNNHNFLTEDLGGLYCFTAFQLYDPTAPLFGVNIDNHSIVSTNPFNTSLYANGNMLIIGKSGSGKTFTEQLLGTRFRNNGMRVNYIIPKKAYNEYRAGCYAVGGSFISLAPGSDTCINIMELMDEAENENIVSDTISGKSLLAQKIRSLTTFTGLLLGREELTTEEESRLDIAITNTYEEFGINNNNDSIYEADGRKKKMPIVSDLIRHLEKDPKLERVRVKYQPFIDGSLKNMNGQTNVDTSNYYTVYDIDDEVIPEKLFPAFMYIAFDRVYSLSKSSRLVFDTIILDEVWRMMINEECAKQVFDMVKIVRGYASLVVLATQDIPDFINSPGGYGKTCLTNTEIKLFLGMKKMELDEVCKVVDISQEDRNLLLTFPRGCGLLYANNEKVPIRLSASELDINSFTTDPNLIQKMAREHSENSGK